MFREINDLFRFYRNVGKSTSEIISKKWRVVVAVISAVIFLAVWEYLDITYSVKCGNPENLFYWFLVGVATGMGIVILMIEGETVISLWRLMKIFDLEEHLDRLSKSLPKIGPKAEVQKAIKTQKKIKKK